MSIYTAYYQDVKELDLNEVVSFTREVDRNLHDVDDQSPSHYHNDHYHYTITRDCLEHRE